MQSKIEKWYPITLGLIITVFCFLLLRNTPVPSPLEGIYSTAANLSIIAVGFLATAMSILFTINDSFIMKQLKNTQAFTRLINYFMDAIRWSFLLATLSWFGLFFDVGTTQNLLIIAFRVIWLFSLITSGLSCYRVIQVFANILRATK